ncbi:glycine oxidase ThiO [Plantactinospora sp. GCM10030261]|uniref:glycine oxidase ThiO n=1 Tax=Plantactinospora sp. GCM10030261 TaxID=3273420 RepID=UPI0036243978
MLTAGRSGSGEGKPVLAVVGGGPVGLAIAWRCAQRGMRVTVYDPAPGSGASAVAAGMLSPVAEATFGERDLTALMVNAAARWPAFAAEVEVAGGRDVGYRTDGTLIVALTADDVAEARRLWTYQQSLDLPLTPLLPTELRVREPQLSTRVRGGAYAPADHQVDPRRLVPALVAAARAAGVRVERRQVDRLSDVDADVVVVAAGTGSATLAGLPVRPVKGQVLRLRAPGGGPPVVRHVIRGYADGRSVYLVPRVDGEVVVGATVEERGDLTVTAGAVLDLLRAAAELVPELAEYELAEARAATRPGTPDNLPYLGPLPGRPGVLVATGHYRHGILLAPITADLVADALTGGEPTGGALAGDDWPAELAPLRPDRAARQAPVRRTTGQAPADLPTGQAPADLPTGQAPADLPTGQAPADRLSGPGDPVEEGNRWN